MHCISVWQFQLQREAEEKKQKEDEEKREKLRLLRERKEMEKKVSEPFTEKRWRSPQLRVLVCRSGTEVIRSSSSWDAAA